MWRAQLFLKLSPAPLYHTFSNAHPFHRGFASLSHSLFFQCFYCARSGTVCRSSHYGVVVNRHGDGGESPTAAFCPCSPFSPASSSSCASGHARGLPREPGLGPVRVDVQLFGQQCPAGCGLHRHVPTCTPSTSFEHGEWTPGPAVLVSHRWVNDGVAERSVSCCARGCQEGPQTQHTDPPL